MSVNSDNQVKFPFISLLETGKNTKNYTSQSTRTVQNLELRFERIAVTNSLSKLAYPLLTHWNNFLRLSVEFGNKNVAKCFAIATLSLPQKQVSMSTTQTKMWTHMLSDDMLLTQRSAQWVPTLSTVARLVTKERICRRP